MTPDSGPPSRVFCSCQRLGAFSVRDTDVTALTIGRAWFTGYVAVKTYGWVVVASRSRRL